MEKIDTASTAAAWSTGAKGIANNLSQITGKLDSLTSSWDVSRATGTINGGDLDSVVPSARSTATSISPTKT